MGTESAAVIQPLSVTDGIPAESEHLLLELEQLLDQIHSPEALSSQQPAGLADLVDEASTSSMFDSLVQGLIGINLSFSRNWFKLDCI